MANLNPIDITSWFTGDVNELKDYSKAILAIDKSLTKLSKTVQQEEQYFKGLSSSISEVSKMTTENIAILAKLTKELDTNARRFKELQAIQKTAKTASDELNKAKRQEILLAKEVAQQKKLEAQASKALSDAEKAEANAKRAKIQASKAAKTAAEAEARENSKLGAIYQQQSRRLNMLRKEYKDLFLQNKQNTTQARALEKEIRKLDSTLKRADARTGQYNRNVGNYTSSIKDAISQTTGFNANITKTQLALGAAVVALTQLIRTASKFENGQAKLAGVLNKNVDELGRLSDNAKELGASTAFAASEVVQLQTEFAKLGFTEDEILNATEATLDFAIAAGVDLANAAEIAGVTVRGFGLDAAETTRVTDVLAKSFSSSALDATKLRESLKFVAPVAKAAGVSIEETTALLGALADAGISGSQAGTSLRRILSELEATGKPVGDALQDLADKGLNLADANDEVGRTAQTALLVLAESTNKVDRLADSFENAQGAASSLADKQLQTLSGRVKLLQSAFEGLFLTVDDGSNSILSFAKGSVDALTNAINFLANFDIAFQDIESASLSARKRMLEVFELEDGRKVKDALNEAFGTLTSQEFLRNLESSKIFFNKVFEEEGLTVKEVDSLWRAYVDTREEAAKQEAEAARLAELANEALGLSVDELRAKVEEYQSVIKTSAEADRGKLIKEQSIFQKELTDRIKEYSDATREAGDETDDFRASLIALSDAVNNIEADLKFELENPEGVREDYQRVLDQAEKIIEDQRQVFEDEQGNLQVSLDFLGGDPRDGFADEDIQPVFKPKTDFEEFQADLDNFLGEYGESINVAVQGINELFEFASEKRRAQNEADLAELEAQKAFELQFVGTNEQKKLDIEQKFAAKEAALKKAQAEQEKKAAIFGIILNTAQAITSALTIPPPAGFVLAGITAALAAVQLATASAASPGFKDGAFDLRNPSGVSGVDKIPAVFGRNNEMIRVNEGESIIPTFGTEKYPNLIQSMIADAPAKEMVDALDRDTQGLVSYEKKANIALMSSSSVDPKSIIRATKEGVRQGYAEQTRKETNITRRGFEKQVKKSLSSVTTYDPDNKF